MFGNLSREKLCKIQKYVKLAFQGILRHEGKLINYKIYENIIHICYDNYKLDLYLLLTGTFIDI